jgi:hypothetical protein
MRLNQPKDNPCPSLMHSWGRAQLRVHSAAAALRDAGYGEHTRGTVGSVAEVVVPAVKRRDGQSRENGGG